MRVFGVINSKENLCDFCMLHPATCPKAAHIKFGDGIGNDNVTECSEYLHESLRGGHPIEMKPGHGVVEKRATND